MDVPYHNSYAYNHEWTIPSTSDTFSSYSSQNHSTSCYPISSCPLPPSSSSYYDYYSSSNCCPSTANTCSTHYNTYSSFSQHNNTNQIGPSIHTNTILNPPE